MTDFLYSILLGLIQGVTEFLPISSTGHLIILRDFLGINTEHGLAFDSVLQLATALSVLVYFRKDICNLVAGVFDKTRTEERKMIKFLVVATIPAVILGLLLQDLMETTFRSTLVVSATLVIGGVIMFVL